jgi:3-deoxy-7-phosphoheptulonate synthase
LTLKISNRLNLSIKSDETQKTIIRVGDNIIGGSKVIIMAGPCSVESREQLMTIAHKVKASGAHMLRGGAFKPRTLPNSFQGLGEEGLKILSDARDEVGLPFVTEVMEPGTVELVESYADILQIGARNMQNYPLLKKVGRAEKPVLLKRGMTGTLEEWLGSAEYILNEGNEKVMLCERGIRTFSKVTRNTLDLSVVPIIKQVSPLPIIVDPSHGTGIRSLVSPMSKAAIIAGADGLILEVHNEPEKALSDGAQSLKPHEFHTLMDELTPIAKAAGRKI